MLEKYFKTAKKAQEYERLYDKVMELWPEGYHGYYVDTAYGKTWIHEIGDSHLPPLLLLHGSYGSSTLWYPNVGDLSRHFRVIAPDIIGQPGKSMLEQPMTSTADLEKWLDEVIGRLGIAQLTLAGMSWGGWLAAQYAVYAPHRINKLIMIDPAEVLIPLKIEFWLRMFVALTIPIPAVGKSFERWLTQGYIMNDDYSKQMDFGISNYKLIKGQKKVYAQVLSDTTLRQLDIPVMILFGAKSALYDKDKAINRAKAFLPCVKTEILPDCAHTINMEQSALVNKRIIHFMEKDISEGTCAIPSSGKEDCRRRIGSAEG